jgi:hypothetical protein
MSSVSLERTFAKLEAFYKQLMLCPFSTQKLGMQMYELSLG